MARSARSARNRSQDRFLTVAAPGLIGALVLLTPAYALDIPAGTTVEIRLKTKVSTQSSKSKDAVEAVVIAPVIVDGQFVIPAGAIVRGAVEKAAASTKP